jgi:hypothetical protein
MDSHEAKAEAPVFVPHNVNVMVWNIGIKRPGQEELSPEADKLLKPLEGVHPAHVDGTEVANVIGVT